VVNKKDLDFSQITSMAVDGDLWLGTKTGQVLKYTSGQPIAWNPAGLQTPLSTAVLIDTSETLTQLYVLEPAKQRLIVFDKSGQFLKELKSPTLASVTTFAVNESLKKAFLVSGSIVYELAL
jgi:DNA-binding beta-propeller fold protein YncE